MPQLNKGGKFVFGISVIQPDFSIHLPSQALMEYHIMQAGKVILFTGSKITGGFCVSTHSLLSKSKLSHILKDCPALGNCSLPEGTFIPYKGRKYSWLTIDRNGVIRLPPHAFTVLELHAGMELLSIRSSNIAFTMGAKGPLWERARKYNGEIPIQ